MKPFKLGSLLALTVLLFTTSGCGGGSEFPDGVKTGTVSGTVTSNGKPLPEGCIVSCYPEGGTGLPAVSPIAADGTFKLRLKGSFDVPTGVYKVVVQPPPPPAMSEEEEMEASMSDTMPSNEIKEIPLKYTATDSTPEVIEVKEGANERNIDLKV